MVIFAYIDFCVIFDTSSDNKVKMLVYHFNISVEKVVVGYCWPAVMQSLI